MLPDPRKTTGKRVWARSIDYQWDIFYGVTDARRDAYYGYYCFNGRRPNRRQAIPLRLRDNAWMAGAP